MFQEALRAEPFWMLVACQLVNRATWTKARGVLTEVRRAWSTPWLLADAEFGDLEVILRPLGLSAGRTRNLTAFAAEWRKHSLTTSWGDLTREKVLALPGCGPYDADSWAIFVEGRRDVMPTDHKLTWYAREVLRVRV